MAKTICVIDDEPGILSEMEAWLQDSGYDVMTATSGDRAIEMMKEKRAHLVLLDIIMPKTDGLEVLSRLKANGETADIPVIMLSAKKETGTIMRAQAFQATDYFFKPFDPMELLRSIRRHI